MKPGIVFNLMTDYGATEELNVLCSFNYDDQNYILAIDEENDYVCRKIKFNPWKGTYIDTNPVSKEVIRIGNILLRKADSNKYFDFLCLLCAYYSFVACGVFKNCEHTGKISYKGNEML